MIEYIKKQPISIVLVAVIWVVCMIPVPETPLNDISFIDKWTHFAMYGLLTLIIQIEYGRRKQHVEWQRLCVYGIMAPVIMGGLVELAQAYLTNGVRSGDWLDFAANSTGVIIGCLIGIPLARCLSRRNKDS